VKKRVLYKTRFFGARKAGPVTRGGALRESALIGRPGLRVRVASAGASASAGAVKSLPVTLIRFIEAVISFGLYHLVVLVVKSV